MAPVATAAPPAQAKAINNYDQTSPYFRKVFRREIYGAIFSVGTSGVGCKGLFCCYIHLSPCTISAAEASLEKLRRDVPRTVIEFLCLCNLRKQERIHGADF
jgi:hypothetical protein